MVIVRLNGGLGNQMFQYAMARAVAHRRQTSVGLDLQVLKRDRKRCYSLGAWNINAVLAAPNTVFRIRATNALHRVLKPHAPYYLRPVVRELSFCFHADALNAPRHCLLIGFWQSEKYFLDIEPIIRQEFTLRTEPSARSQEIARVIALGDSVSMHIRRGDFITDPYTRKTHGIPPADYYRDAAEYVAQYVDRPHFFIFSDEPQWVKEHVKLPFTMTVVDHNQPGDPWQPGREHEDLWLMAQCQHSILANSSFSWWGAWLHPTRKRLVIAPKHWTQSSTYITRDLIPEEWLRM